MFRDRNARRNGVHVAAAAPILPVLIGSQNLDPIRRGPVYPQRTAIPTLDVSTSAAHV
jgi:hypothetical protein